ncbi:putative beta-D-xylosidase 7 [Apium graveolens]|uniref:putative beta-D-xylosidase 7 n=1 Tax=Apium graveolens TaxID=4045 RepID=UPI003D78E10C
MNLSLTFVAFLFAFTINAIVIHAESTQLTQPPPFSCDSSNPSTKSYQFCNTSLPIHQRVDDLVTLLTLDEKITQLINSAAAIPRLGVSAFEWWSEGLHGISRHGKGVRFNGTIRSATMFPQVILTAASFDSLLWYRIAQAIGREARAIYNVGQAKGLTFWAPNINIFRDPRWGRGQETPGEDPLVSGKYAVSFVRGIQGDSFEGGYLKDGHLQISACCKHFTAYDLDNWTTVDRYVFDAHVTQQDLADSYQPPFQSCVEQGQASGIMCAYNRVNGVPNCADYNLLTKTARGLWGFQGYIASDCDGVATIYDPQRYAALPEDAVADVLKAGMDVNCGSHLKKYTKSAIEQNKINESDVDTALRNLFSVQMRLGFYNGDPRTQSLGNIGPDQVCSNENLQLALEAARSGIVLLKNSANFLPLPKTKTFSLALIGPSANSTDVFLANYEGPPCKNITLLQAFQGYVKSTAYHQGCDYVNCTRVMISETMKLAKTSDYVVLVMGLDQSQEREKYDRVNLVLPGKQQYLITNVAKVSKKPVVLVVLSGGPVDILFARDDPNIASILWAGYPGEAGGTALTEIIFGDHNPGGKLPVTWYTKDFVRIPMTDMRMRPDQSTGYPGRTYRFYNGPKVYEFGYGLSYSNYTYEFTSVSPKTVSLAQLSDTLIVENCNTVPCVQVSKISNNICDKAKFQTIVKVQNNGQMPGKHPVLLFLKPLELKNGDPIKQLIGFQSVDLHAGEESQVEFVLNPCEHLSKATRDGLMIIEEASYNLIVGDKEYPFKVVI